MSDTKVEVDMNRDAPSRIALEMTYHLIGSTEKRGDEYRQEFLDLYAQCLEHSEGLTRSKHLQAVRTERNRARQ